MGEHEEAIVKRGYLRGCGSTHAEKANMPLQQTIQGPWEREGKEAPSTAWKQVQTKGSRYWGSALKLGEGRWCVNAGCQPSRSPFPLAYNSVFLQSYVPYVGVEASTFGTKAACYFDLGRVGQVILSFH